MQDDPKRRFPRKLVHLKVTYERAAEFVEQYATNLSMGGMFLPGCRVAIGETVAVTLELPLHGTLELHCQVQHVSAGGAGVRIVNGPPECEKILEAYLMRLGKRTTASVYVDADPWRKLIADAGYDVRPVPSRPELRKILAELRALAIMPPVAEAEDYAVALRALGADEELVIPIHDELPLEPVLAWLDERLLSSDR